MLGNHEITFPENVYNINKITRRMSGSTLKDRQRSESNHRKLEVPLIEGKIREKNQLRWFGYVQEKLIRVLHRRVI